MSVGDEIFRTGFSELSSLEVGSFLCPTFLDLETFFSRSLFYSRTVKSLPTLT